MVDIQLQNDTPGIGCLHSFLPQVIFLLQSSFVTTYPGSGQSIQFSTGLEPSRSSIIGAPAFARQSFVPAAAVSTAILQTGKTEDESHFHCPGRRLAT